MGSNRFVRDIGETGNSDLFTRGFQNTVVRRFSIGALGTLRFVHKAGSRDTPRFFKCHTKIIP